LNASVHLLHKVVPATVHLRAEIPSDHASAEILGTERMGTGTLTAEGYIVTAHYLLIGAQSVSVTLVDGATSDGHVLGIDYASGLGVLTAGGEITGPRLETRPSDDVALGEDVFLVASVADGRRVNSGVVTSKAPFEAFWEYVVDPAITTTADNPGLGGGPLLDARGRLVGIIVLSLAEVGKFTLAVPADRALAMLEEITRQGAFTPPAPRAWLGLTCYTLREHIVVAGLLPNSPADQAGLKSGDVIVAIDGEAMHDRRSLYTRIWQHPAGDSVSLRVFRGGEVHDVRIVSGSIETFFA
jgi:serine protease DegS